jgi:CelD/BcsL family acetyltransferase involved in cellulose biosynthesis
MTLALDVVELKSIEALDRLRPEWADLYGRCPSATPFQSPAWLIPWWRYFGHSELVAVAIRAGGELVGLAPLFIWQDGPVRKLVPAGAGVTDYLDALFSPGYERTGAEAVFAYLQAIRRRWDLFWSPDLRPDSMLLQSAAPAGWGDQRTVTEHCPVLALPACLGGLTDSVPDSKLRKLRYYRRRTDKLGGVAIERAGVDNVEELFSVTVELHGAEWRAKGEPGMLAEPEVLAFHREVVKTAFEAGMLRLYGFRLQRRPVASLYALAGHGITCVYLGAYDPSLAQLGLGTLSVGTAIEEAVEEGQREFHFLRGREEHKYSWGAKDVPTFSRTLRPGELVDRSS